MSTLKDWIARGGLMSRNELNLKYDPGPLLPTFRIGQPVRAISAFTYRWYPAVVVGRVERNYEINYEVTLVGGNRLLPDDLDNAVRGELVSVRNGAQILRVWPQYLATRNAADLQAHDPKAQMIDTAANIELAYKLDISNLRITDEMMEMIRKDLDANFIEGGT